MVPGFGISTPDHVREYTRAGADGVIVGSALISIIAERDYRAREAGSESALGALVKGMKNAAQRR